MCKGHYKIVISYNQYLRNTMQLKKKTKKTEKHPVLAKFTRHGHAKTESIRVYTSISFPRSNLGAFKILTFLMKTFCSG